MKKLFGIYCKSEEVRSEKQLFTYTGIPKEYINFLDVETVKGEYIHVFIVDDYTIKNKV